MVCRVLRAGAFYGGIVFGIGFALGVVRVTQLVPRLGVRVAELLEMPLMLVAIVAAASLTVGRSGLPPTPGVQLGVGATALALIVAAELLLAWLANGQTPGEAVTSHDPVSGAVYWLLLGVLSLMPLLLARRRRADW